MKLLRKLIIPILRFRNLVLKLESGDIIPSQSTFISNYDGYMRHHSHFLDLMALLFLKNKKDFYFDFWVFALIRETRYHLSNNLKNSDATNFEIIELADILKNVAPLSDASARANWVLPVPGGP